MPPRQRQVLLLPLQLFTPAEIAEQLELEPGTVRARLIDRLDPLAIFLCRTGAHDEYRFRTGLGKRVSTTTAASASVAESPLRVAPSQFPSHSRRLCGLGGRSLAATGPLERDGRSTAVRGGTRILDSDVCEEPVKLLHGV
ncbi:sigma factor-like helix-turn-helix DNA-binding protein [Streptomyces sp. NPDC002730]|uniref:sigma factor-like helix-turn-helix DNA-binding protein n=1 Tax=Streptomyces sp. NPDC002730 TaxID=3364662 RepID=UPI0036D02F2A